MTQISEYLKETETLGEYVNEVSRLLNKNSTNLNDLAQQLEILFNLFSRGDELIGIIQDYSINLQRDINNVKNSYSHYEKSIEEIDKRLVYISKLLKSITDVLHDIQTNAGLFIKSAQSLANLAKNTEIRAYHAKKEGKGLAVIAKECLALAKLAQLPFRDFSTLLQNLKEIAKPVIVELNRIIEVSSRSRKLLSKSFESLKTIDETTVSLQKIITQIEKNSSVNSQLKIRVSEGLDILKNQLLMSLNTIDDISIHCAHISSLSQILDTLSNVLSSINSGSSKENANIVHHLESGRRKYVTAQFKFFLNENIKFFSQFSTGKEPPLFPCQVYNNLINITNQIKALNISINEMVKYKENLGFGMADVIELGIQIENFLKEIQAIYNTLNDLGNDLNCELTKIENLVSTTSKIFTKIKTLSVFARIEEGRSIEHQNIISPIVGEFVELESETEKAFSNITPQIIQLKKSVQNLKKEKATMHLEKTKHPDYSKIKIFLDDIVRVFREEKEQVKDIHTIAEELNEENMTLKETWQGYEGSVSRISKISRSFSGLLKEEKIEAPAVIKGKNVVSVSLPNDPLTLKPDLKTDVNSHQVICNFSSGLFQFGEGVDLTAGLCEYYSISQDGTEYTFRLRGGLRYQNGKFLRIEHIKDALIKALEGPNFNFFDMIAGAKDFIQTRDKASLEIKIINNSTLKVKLEYPFLPILANLATDIADPYFDGELPIGMGPFKIIGWEKGEKILLAANDYYFEGRPPVDELHFLIIKDEKEGYELFKNGTLSIYQPTGEVLKKIKAETPKLLCSIPELSVQYLCINCEKEPFDNKLVRKAVAYAIDTKRLVDTFLKGNAIPARGIFPPSMKVHNHKLQGYKFNLIKAKDLLSEAGFKNGLPGIYPLDVSDTPSVIRRAEFIKSSLSNIGVRIEINSMPWQSLIEKTYANESILSFRGWVSDNGDPDNFVYPLFHSTSRGRTGNTFFFSSPEIDQDIDFARKIRNLNQRNLLYRKIEEKILDESPAVFLFHRLQNVAIQKDILGLKPHPLGLVRAKYVYPIGKRCFVPFNLYNEKQIKVSNMVYSRP